MVMMTLLLSVGFVACSNDDDDNPSSKYHFVGKTYSFTPSWGTGGWKLMITFDSDSTFYFRTENTNGDQGEGNEDPEVGSFFLVNTGYGISNISMMSYRCGFRNYRITLYGEGTFNSDYSSISIPTYVLFNSGNSINKVFTYTLPDD